MADRMVDPENNMPEGDIDDVLKTVILAVLNEAADKMEEGKDVIPFTGLAVKENLFIETHPGDDPAKESRKTPPEGGRKAMRGERLNVDSSVTRKQCGQIDHIVFW